ncbi:BglG family transcription antiterminator [Collinsella tanakaei]|uniref:BglG family transcription antiterminator n=1 Tax=Collinsella tanakaei TaxID=626935 RepID=UPI00315D8847
MRHILKHEGIAPTDLSAYLGTKERAMRDRIRHANDAMGGSALIAYSRAAGGYVVKVSDERAFKSWLEGTALRDPFDRLPSTPQERADYLLQDLLSRSDWITLEDLASLLFVSRSTISSDLRHIEQVLERFHLTIEKRPRYGIRVAGDEMNRRICLASIAVDTRLADDELSGAISPDMLDTVGACVSDALEAEQYKINPVSHQNLVVHIAIAIARIRKECYVPMEAAHLEHVRGTREYAVAGTVAGEIERRFDIDLPEEEIAYIAIHLASKHLVEGGSPTSIQSGEEANLEITDEAWNLAAEMLETVWRAFRFDFRNDAELRMNLARHTMPLIVRLRYNMALENPLLPDIKARYPLPFSMAADALSLLADRLDTTVSDDEIGYVALFFALALERTKTAHAKKRVLVVCASGAGSARLLAYRLQSDFSADFEHVETCDASDFEARDLTGIDYIFTTVPLTRRVSIPVVHISLFLDDTSRRDVKRALDQDSTASVKTYFSPDLFFPHLALRTREEIISYLCAACAAYDTLPDNFEELVWQRERAAATSFGNMVALPHPYEAVSTRTFVAVALLDDPVDWNGTPVQAVFMVCVARDAGADLEAFYRAIGGLLTQQSAIQKLTSDMRFDVLLSELEGE